MSLNIKNPDVEELARQVARATGETMTEAIRRSLMERRDRLGIKESHKVIEDLGAEIEKVLHGRHF